jgi:hypothetical protein
MLTAERTSRQESYPSRWPEGPPSIYEQPREQQEFLRRLGIAEAIKGPMREKYVFATRVRRASFDDMRRRAEDFWSTYEEINRLWVPEDPVYSKVTTGTAASTTNSTYEVKSPAAGQLRVLESFIGGEAAASAVLRMQLNRVATEGTGTAPTIYGGGTGCEKFNTRSPNSASTVYGALSANVAWGTAQEALNANPLFVHAINAFGGTDRWVAQPGEEVYLVNAEEASLRSFSGTSVISAYLVFEEL